MSIKLYCDKCNSEEVETFLFKDKEEKKRVSMANYEPNGGVVTLEYRPKKWVIRCKNCGNRRETYDGLCQLVGNTLTN